MPKQTIDYSTGKIYKIISSTSNYVYIGSTTNTLSTRFSIHKSKYKLGKVKALNIMFDNNNIDNCYIELIKNYPCSCRNELEREEGIELRKINNDTSTKEICLNYNIPGRTKKEYYENNKGEIAEKQKQYRDSNKEKISEKQKEYYENNKGERLEKQKQYYNNKKETIVEKQKQYYEKSKGEILEKANQNYTCECGGKYSRAHKTHHEKTKKHQSFINSQITNIELYQTIKQNIKEREEKVNSLLNQIYVNCSTQQQRKDVKRQSLLKYLMQIDFLDIISFY